jgi:hypothetical protein
MKLYSVLLSLFICLALNGAEASTNRLAIYLVAEAVTQKQLDDGTVEPEGVKLMPQPVLSDADFVSYNSTNHSFGITPEAANRLAHSLKPGRYGPIVTEQDALDCLWAKLDPKAFVLVASGQRIYVGVFRSFFSQAEVFYRGYPLIWSRNPWVVEKLPRRVTFDIVSAEDILPLPGKQRTERDVRDDPRILGALKELGL